MKEYTITLSLTVHSNKANYEKITDFAEELSENIINDYSTGGINIVETSVIEVEDLNDYDKDDDYLEEDDDY